MGTTSEARQPNAYQLMQAMTALQQAKHRLLEEDAELLGDSFLLQSMLEGDVEAGDCMEVLYGVIRASVIATSMADAAKDLADKMAARAQRYARRAMLLRNATLNAMQSLELPKIEQPDFTASIAKGAGGQVHVTDASLLTTEYLRHYSEPNKAAISAALKAGTTVPGAELGNSPPAVRIATR